MATNYPTFQSDPVLNSVTASTGISSSGNAYIGTKVGVGTTGGTDKLNVSGAISLQSAGSYYRAYNEDSKTVKFANWYASQSDQWGQGQLFYELWFGAINTTDALNKRRIGFYTTLPDNGVGSLTTNADMYIKPSGVEIKNNLAVSGNITLSNAGAIVFGSSFGAPGGASTTLNDYEEGTWTPSFLASTTTNFTHTTQLGRYTKIGNKTFIEGRIVISSTGSSSGLLYIGNLPFSANSNPPVGLMTFYNTNFQSTGANAISGSIMGAVSNNNTYMNLYTNNSAGGNTTCGVTNLTNAAEVYFSGFYTVA